MEKYEWGNEMFKNNPFCRIWRMRSMASSKQQPCGQTCYLKLDRLQGKVAEVDDYPCVALPSTTVGHQIMTRCTCDNKYTLDRITSEWSQWLFKSPVLFLIDVQSQSVDSQVQVCALLVLDLKVVDAIHFQVLSNLQVLNHGLFPVQVKQTKGTMEKFTQPALSSNILTLWGNS